MKKYLQIFLPANIPEAVVRSLKIKARCRNPGHQMQNTAETTATEVLFCPKSIGGMRILPCGSLPCG
jgi:hypothetical protein